MRRAPPTVCTVCGEAILPFENGAPAGVTCARHHFTCSACVEHQMCSTLGAAGDVDNAGPLALHCMADDFNCGEVIDGDMVERCLPSIAAGLGRLGARVQTLRQRVADMEQAAAAHAHNPMATPAPIASEHITSRVRADVVAAAAAGGGVPRQCHGVTRQPFTPIAGTWRRTDATYATGVDSTPH